MKLDASLRSRILSARDLTTRTLVDALAAVDHWDGELSSSALSTAVATIALGELDRAEAVRQHESQIDTGLQWLATFQNDDGGWGDTTRSRSNLSTTALGWAAFGAAKRDHQFPKVAAAAEAYLKRAAGSLEHLVPAIENRYGDDRTFSVPIVLTLAVSGRLGPDGWRKVKPLPFELAALPRSWFGILGLPVVSYALPALIGLGQAIHHHAPSRNPLARLLRRCSAARTLQMLETLQPANGGFLEATPLTAFVTMSLASMRQHRHPVARRGAEFLRASVREHGSWPIDTNLSTWVTTLSINALDRPLEILGPARAEAITDWLLRQQFSVRHPYTGAAPGGWAWTPLPGGVPDADDTAGALLALHRLNASSERTAHAASRGLKWLLDLQNNDGGVPTFCRGWGKLPFDRSAPDLTAHSIRAWDTWSTAVPEKLRTRAQRSATRAIRYLQQTQRPDGSWIPLWFGNEAAREEANPVYGTAQVVQALTIQGPQILRDIRSRGTQFLRGAQNPDGGWGGDRGIASTLEESALALRAIVTAEGISEPVIRGLVWLLDQIEAGNWKTPSPVGLYFARLWYWERLYPIIHATAALGQIAAETGSAKNTEH